MYALINSPDLKNLYCFWTLKYFFIVNRCVFLRGYPKSHATFKICVRTLSQHQWLILIFYQDFIHIGLKFGGIWYIISNM